MKNAITISLLAVLTVVVSFLVYQNYSLNKKVEELSSAKTETTGPATDNKVAPPIDPAAESPFDKPHKDPLENTLPIAPPKDAPVTSVSFERLKHDFGRITDGEYVNTKFRFKNTGKYPLFIMKAEGSCGCTVPRWTREPIAPGEAGDIYVQFDSHGKKGEVEKTVTVTSNTTPPKTVLTIKSLVVPVDK